jgi:hypothetical protein
VTSPALNEQYTAHREKVEQQRKNKEKEYHERNKWFLDILGITRFRGFSES